MRWCAAAVMSCLGVLAVAQEIDPWPDTTRMAEGLLQRQAYVCENYPKEDIDVVRRDLREAERLTRQNMTDEQKQEGIAKREAARDKLLTILQAAPRVHEIDIPAEPKTLPPLPPLDLPGSSAAMLFRITQGAGPIQFLSRTFDLSVDASAIFTVNVPQKGTTWVLVALERVPQGRTSLELRFEGENAIRVTLPFETRTLANGTLDMRVLSDESSDPTPAMVRLVWKTDGSEVRPANAVDLGQLFDSQGSATGLRRAQYPGKFNMAYWCVPGPFRMSLAPGEYDVTVLRGVEHLPVHDTITVQSGKAVERSYRPRRWVDMRDHGWYSGDDHVHTQILSDRDASMVMSWIQAEDVHLANIVKMGDICRTWFEQRGFGKDFRVEDNGYILSPGQECPRTHGELGHTISMNITSMVRNTEQYYLYDTVFDEVHRQGGLSGYAHVNTDLFYVHRDMTLNIPKNRIDFVELLQFANLGTTQYYDFLNLGFKVTASAGSDVPWGGSVGEVRVYAHTGKKHFTADRWFEAVREGHTFVTNGLMVDFSVNGSIPGDEVVADDGRPLSVKAKVWGNPDRDVPAKLEVVVQGEPVKTATTENPDQTSLELNFDLPAGNGFWIAARAEGRDGSRAHTTPVYVVKPGLRFWKFDSLEELLAKREASLAEIEHLVSEAQAGRNNDGKPDTNRPVTELAEQGPALLERVKDARKIYADLRATAEHEATLRK